MNNVNTFKIINDEWTDNIILNFHNNILIRETDKKEKAKFTLINNILSVEWDNWDDEYFVHSYDKIFYKCHKFDFYDEDWEDTCYIDNINNLIFRNSSNLYGNIEYLFDDNININWKEIDFKFINHNINIKYFNNDYSGKIENQIENYNIPNIIHFIYGFKRQESEFELYKYIAIKSAIDVNNPDKVYFHYKYEPHGIWWNKIKPYLTLEYVEPPEEIYGNNLHHYAHQSDVIRLQKLCKYGGIYLDIDTICLKSFQDLRNNKFVLGIQPNKAGTQIYGLCNAVMLSEKNSEFAIKWIDEYTTFRSKGRDTYWDEHSVIIPLKLAYNNPNLVSIIENNCFYNPLWYDINEYLFNENINIENYKKLINKNYCIHLWDTYSNEHLSNININSILNINTLYNIIARKFIQNKISLVFLTYNRFEITKKCLESYLKCLDVDYIKELIIFDNNSDGYFRNYLKTFQKKHYKIKIIYSDKNLGVCGGRIKLFELATGDIIASLDSDAYLEDINFFEIVIKKLYDEKYGIIGISGAFIKSWDFGNQEDINEDDTNEYYCHHIAGCCQIFRKDLQLFGFKLDSYYGFFWVEDTDLSMQSLNLNKINFRINSKNLMKHNWGGSGKDYHELFQKNWKYFRNKWQNKVLKNIS